MKRWISRYLLGVIVLGNVTLFFLARQQGWNLEWVVLLGTLGTLAGAAGHLVAEIVRPSRMTSRIVSQFFSILLMLEAVIPTPIGRMKL